MQGVAPHANGLRVLESLLIIWLNARTTDDANSHIASPADPGSISIRKEAELCGANFLTLEQTATYIGCSDFTICRGARPSQSILLSQDCPSPHKYRRRKDIDSVFRNNALLRFARDVTTLFRGTFFECIAGTSVPTRIIRQKRVSKEIVVQGDAIFGPGTEAGGNIAQLCVKTCGSPPSRRLSETRQFKSLCSLPWGPPQTDQRRGQSLGQRHGCGA